MRRDQAIIGIAGCVAALSKAGVVKRLLEFQVKDLALLYLSFPVHPLRLERSLDRKGFYRAQQFACNRCVYPWTTEGHASGQAHHQVGLVATIDGPTLRVAGVRNAQSPSAPSARHDP